MKFWAGILLLTNLALAWDVLPPLPRAISGQCAGVSNGALLVIGGSYFPTPYFEGGRKTWVDTIYVFERGSWREFHAPRPIGYAACVTDSDGVIVVGGGNADENFRTAFRVTWDGKAIHTSSLPSLPEPIANGAAALIGRRVFAAGGQNSPTATSASRALWTMNLDEPKKGWQRLEDCPGPGRILPAMAAHNGAILLASGAELVAAPDGKPQRRYLRDAWSYRPGTGWSRLPDLPKALVAAPVISRPNAVYLFGGDDGANAARIQELKEKHPGFSREILSWRPDEAKWTPAGGYPAGLVTTMAVEWSGHVVIPGGEDRPGHRSDLVVTIPAERLP